MMSMLAPGSYGWERGNGQHVEGSTIFPQINDIHCFVDWIDEFLDEKCQNFSFLWYFFGV